MKYHHVFGPVPSRRLGISLGVDLVYHKVCSLNCVYCECGKTTDLTLERKPFVPFDRVIQELDHYFSHHPDPDYVTFSGSGEPTLSGDIGQVISHIKGVKPGVKVAVLTNSSLLCDPNVRKELALADMVMPSLDAVFQKTFIKINRPCKGLFAQGLIDGLTAFAREFKGMIWLEIFVLPGVNDSLQELEAFNEVIHGIRPARVQLNTLDRPGTLKTIRPATRAELDRVAEFLDMDHIEIIAKVKNIESRESLTDEEARAMALETIHRRPCTVEDLASVLNRDRGQVEILLKTLLLQGRVESAIRDRGVFYRTVKGQSI